jgi:uncharacterized membrane protein YgdD (TMEM256/DUF423 family)
MERRFISLGALLAGIGVAMGAFGTHGLREKVSERMLETWQTAVQYHVIHAVALVLVGVLAERFAAKALAAVGWLFVTGVILFAGTLYAYVLTGQKFLAMITPLGGVCFIVGWLFLSYKFLREGRRA